MRFTINPVWGPTLDQLIRNLADRMPDDGTEYRIGHISPTHSRPEIKRPGKGWQPMRKGIGYLVHSKTYWMLVFAVQTLDLARDTPLPHYASCPFCGLSPDDAYPKPEDW